MYYSIRDSSINNPVYSSNPRGVPSKENTTLPGYEEHIYDTIIGECEKEKIEVKNKGPSKNSQKQPKNDADRVSIVSDDVLFEDTEGYCTSNVKESKAHYSKNGKLKPQPKPRHNKPTATSTAVHYDVPGNNHSVSAHTRSEYASLDVTRTAKANNSNDYQQLIVQPPPPPGYAVPTNVPATSTTLESYSRPSS